MARWWVVAGAVNTRKLDDEEEGGRSGVTVRRPGEDEEGTMVETRTEAEEWNGSRDRPHRL